MNLHEECLLKYLSNPVNLIHTTELLKYNNSLLEGLYSKNKKCNKNLQFNGISHRI